MTVTRDDVIAAAKKWADSPDVEIGQCQRLIGRTAQELLIRAGMVAEGNAYFADGYTSATAGFQDSDIYSMNPDDIQLLDIVYCAYTQNGHDYGHVWIGLGPNRGLSITGNLTGAVNNWGNGLVESDIRKYTAQPGRAFRGISKRNGRKPNRIALAAALAPPLAPNQREVLGTKGLNIRSTAAQNGTLLGSLPRGSRFSPTGFLPDGGAVDGSPIKLWYAIPFEKGAGGIAYVWGGGATEASGHDLADLSPKVPVIHTVRFDSGATGFNVDVEDGKPVPEPDKLAREGYTFDGWYFGTTPWNFEAPVFADITLEPHFTEIVPELPGPGEEPVDDDEGGKVPTGQIPIVVPNLDNLDDAAVILADAVSPWLSSGVRAKVYEWGQIAAGAFGSIAGLGTVAALVFSTESQVGTIGASIAVISGALATATGIFTNRLARKNTPLEAAKRLAARGEPLGVATVAKIRANNE